MPLADIDDGGGDLTGRRIGVKWNANVLGGEGRVVIPRDRLFLERGSPGHRCHHFDDDVLGPRQQHFVGRHLDLFQPGLREVLTGADHQLVVARRACDVRLAGEDSVFGPDRLDARLREKVSLECGLDDSALAGEAEHDGPGTLPRRQRRKGRDDDSGWKKNPPHGQASRDNR